MSSLLPLLRKELTSLSRRRRTLWLRLATLALLCLLTLPLLVQLLILSERLYSAKSVAEGLYQVFVWVQFLLLIAAAPAFSASTIAVERERGTIDLLRLASIRGATFTVGKLLGAAALPALLVASEVPFLFVWTLFGGIAVGSIFATLGLSAATTVLLVAVGVFSSAATRSSGVALVLSYLLAIGYLTVQWWGDVLFPTGFEEWLLHVALFRSLRTQGLSVHPWWNAAAASLAVSLLLGLGAGLFLLSPPSVSRLLDRTRVGSTAVRRSRPVGDHPIFWRELNGGGSRRVAGFLALITLASVGCLVAAMWVSDDGLRTALGSATVVLPAVAGGVLGALSVSGEKESGAIAALLLIPSPGTTVVMGKFLGACARALPLTAVPFLLGFMRMEETWMWASVTSVLVSLLMISTGILFSTIFAKSAVAVAATFGGTVVYTFCCCNSFAMFPMMLMAPDRSIGATRWIALPLSIVLYSVMIGSVLLVAVGLFESRARDALR